MKNLVQDGKTIQYVVAGKAVQSGGIVILEDVVGIAVTGGDIGDLITLSIEGVYSLPKGSGAIAKGKKVYVNVTEGVATVVTTATSNTFIGYAWEAASAGDGKVDVKLSF
jgi:predicted RecA/RadA family phage recombinase